MRIVTKNGNDRLNFSGFELISLVNDSQICQKDSVVMRRTSWPPEYDVDSHEAKNTSIYDDNM